MALISAFNLCKSYGATDIFENLSVSIPERARIGLVGSNGVGKTTLLRILVGEEEPSSGSVQRSRGLRLGYLPQDARLTGDCTLWESCLEACKDLLARQAELTEMENELQRSPDSAELLEAYGRLQHIFEHAGGYTYENRIRQTLTGLGFSKADEQRPLTQLSGGQLTRALLARLLLTSPDLLLLDEPTNHLDIAAVEWLEATLKDWPGAVLIISHDRYFLDQVARTIWEMTPALEIYHGNYSAYNRQRSERYTRRLEEYQTQQAFIEKEEEYIRRNIAGQNTRQAQGRRKRLERLLDEARLAPPIETRRLRLQLSSGERSGDLVLRTHALSVGYADEGKPLFSVPDLILLRRECAAIIGPNGAGKTTLLKTLLSQIPPLAGETEMGANIKIGYFAQAHEDLHRDWTLLQEIEIAAPHMRLGDIRDYLARFLFTGDDVYKEVAVLSGGETARLALACLALSGANLLLLDEPTNHLDLPSQEALQNLLADFAGTILLVSHDRYLIDALATQVWEVLPEESALRLFDGSYSQYKASRQNIEETAAQAIPAQSPVKAAVPKRRSSSSNNQERQKQKRLEALESEIAALEQQLKLISAQLENPPSEAGRVEKLGQEYMRLQTDIDERMAAWADLSDQISQQ
jgi:ATP-binding cassette, subfamily F, member 3